MIQTQPFSLYLVFPGDRRGLRRVWLHFLHHRRPAEQAYDLLRDHRPLSILGELADELMGHRCATWLLERPTPTLGVRDSTTGRPHPMSRCFRTTCSPRSGRRALTLSIVDWGGEPWPEIANNFQHTLPDLPR